MTEDDDIAVADRILARFQRGVVTQREMTTAETPAFIRAYAVQRARNEFLLQHIAQIIPEIESHRANAIASMALHDANTPS